MAPTLPWVQSLHQSRGGSTRTSVDDHLTLLLAVGHDAVGDVAVTPHGAAIERVSPVVTADVEDLVLDEVFASATSVGGSSHERIGLPGVQPKVSAEMMSAPVLAVEGPAILKLNPPGYVKLVENEHFFLGVAARCGLRVPPHRLVHDRVGATGLLIRRFDRVRVKGEGYRRLPQEDACQVAGRYPSAKYRLSLQEAIDGLAATVHAYGGSRPLAVRTCLEVAAFSYLIGNGDLHGKNLSIRANGRGVWETTPAYDLLSTQPYLGWHDPMALSLYGRANRLTRRYWLEAAERLGLPPRALPRRLVMTFGRVVGLDGVDVDLYPGEVLAIIGDNGAGKSTLVKAMTGALQPDAGEIRVDGRPVSFKSPQEARRAGIETVYQTLAVAPALDIASNLFLGRERRRPGPLGSVLRMMDKKGMKEAAGKSVSDLGIGTIQNMSQAVETLSGGQRQAVAVARAATFATKFVVLDEPTAALGVKETGQVLNLIRQIKARGPPVILISHNMPNVFEVADRIHIQRLGGCAGVITPQSHTPTEAVAIMTGAATLQSG